MEQEYDNFDDKAVGMQIRCRRVELNISQERLGTSVGITFQQIQKYEKGTNRVSAGMLVRIAQVLQITDFNYFFLTSSAKFENVGAVAVRTEIMDFLLNNDGLKIARSIVALPPRMKKSVLDLLAALKSHVGEETV